jgi:hypothetical protein
MFISARNALTTFANRRYLPFDACVQFETKDVRVPWDTWLRGRSVDFLADGYNDLRAMNFHARIINPDTGEVLFSG